MVTAAAVLGVGALGAGIAGPAQAAPLGGLVPTAAPTASGAPSTPTSAAPTSAAPASAAPTSAVPTNAGPASTSPATSPSATPRTATAQGAAALVPGTPCTATAKACVDLATNEAWLINAGKVSWGPVPIMPGDVHDPTPVGTFHVEWKDQNHVSDMPNRAPMPFSVFFAPGGVAFHEGSLRNPSYGCVHLTRADAIEFFDHLQVGDEVQVH